MGSNTSTEASGESKRLLPALARSLKRSATKTQGWRRRVSNFNSSMIEESLRAGCLPCQKKWENLQLRLQALPGFRGRNY